jgi:hypothetical protein
MFRKADIVGTAPLGALVGAQSFDPSRGRSLPSSTRHLAQMNLAARAPAISEPGLDLHPLEPHVPAQPHVRDGA